eukprot:TRINITY_DN7470_c0_g1_i1.p1 TRINITY_DN7470_c0_g1~~TRINITY_DN7470_c0_g1_i1.p1  ORF type:complete len:280 (-),score=52.86 TRINITY_DN7470_c0_g1_i1:24-863(-)
MEGLLHLLFVAWKLFWLYCKWLWLLTNQAIFETGTGAFKSKYSHRILFFGDGFAAGFGDYVTFGTVAGVSGRIRRFLRSSPTIRQQWWLVQRGHLKATSADWLPNSTDRPKEMSLFVRKSLWKSLLESNKELLRSDIAVVVLGTFDFRDESIKDAQATVENIDTICRKLKELGFRLIYVCNVLKDVPDPEVAKMNAERHVLIADYLKKNEGWVKAGPDLSHYRFTGKYARSADEMHFNDHVCALPNAAQRVWKTRLHAHLAHHLHSHASALTSFAFPDE